MSAVANLHMQIQGSRSGEIKGESRIKDFAGWIELDDWNWTLGLDKPTDATGRKEVAVPSVLSFSKLMDCSSTGMLLAMANGELLKVTISMREASNDPFVLDIRIEDARLVECLANFKSEDKQNLVEETWDMDYRTISFDYRVGTKNISKVSMDRPAWASTSKPKGQGTDDEVIRLTEDLSPDALNSLWLRMQEAATKKRLNPKGTKK